LRRFGLITAKKVLYVANVDDSDPHGKGPLAMKVREHAAAEGSGVVAVSSKLEAELSRAVRRRSQGDARGPGHEASPRSPRWPARPTACSA
jgi:ribosome-binding ATPase YchF (GTP1/OBG family)